MSAFPCNTVMDNRKDSVGDDLSNVALVVKFLEETSSNYSMYANEGREYGYSTDGWAGLGTVLGMVHIELKTIAKDIPSSTE